MPTNTRVPGIGGRDSALATPPCIHCAGSATAPVVTMQRYTVDADPWFYCEECGHVFTTPRGGDITFPDGLARG